MEKDQLDNHKTRWTNCIEKLGWNRSELQPSEVVEDREVWWLNLELLPPQPPPKLTEKWAMKKEEEATTVVNVKAGTRKFN